jgi:hypothetical protein
VAATYIDGGDISLNAPSQKPAIASSAKQTGNRTMRASNDASVAAAVARPFWERSVARRTQRYFTSVTGSLVR